MALAHSAPAGLSLALALAACSGDADEKDTGGAAPSPSLIPQLAVADMSTVTEAAVIDLSANSAFDLVQAGEARLIDVRTDREVAQGMIPGAEPIAMDRFDPAQVAGSAGLPVILYCRSGRRSRVVAEKLADEIGNPVAHIEGGILSWQAQGLPVTTPTSAQ